ncbi:MAG: hypothetical protein B0A82_06690 [Alkalinema sp. CACIAM 70d]|nr:MAG: hypothetical protein B0A82_06690 [Alkalinema sp. CACIAM 70d]
MLPSVLSLGLLLGAATTLWVVPTTLMVPQAQASTARLDISLDRVTNESYTSFIRRAELVARAAAQRSFDRDILTSSVVIHVLGRNQGAEAPVLTLEVTRENWRKRPDTRTWATYYRMANNLLGFPFSPTDAPINPPTGTPFIPAIPATVAPSPNSGAPAQPLSEPPTSSDVK